MGQATTVYQESLHHALWIVSDALTTLGTAKATVILEKPAIK